jgi:hypothetical protein
VQIRADQIRGVSVNQGRAQNTNGRPHAALTSMRSVWITKARTLRSAPLKGCLRIASEYTRPPNRGIRGRQKSGEDPKPVKARRQPRTNLEWLQLPFAEVQSEHLEAFKEARLKQVARATVDRELDLLSAVIHKAIVKWKIVVPINPMLGVERPEYRNGRDRRFQGDEQERLFRSARREDLIRSRKIALEAKLVETRAHAKDFNASWRQR